MAMNMANRFTELGGEIKYGTQVKKVLIKKGKAVGLVTADTQIPADAVIITSDTLSAIDQLFETPLREPWADQMRKNTKLANCTFVCLGIEADLSGLPESIIYSLDHPLISREIRSLPWVLITTQIIRVTRRTVAPHSLCFWMAKTGLLCTSLRRDYCRYLKPATGRRKNIRHESILASVRQDIIE